MNYVYTQQHVSNKLEFNQFIHNHDLVIHYPGFDMQFTSRLWQVGGTQYTIGDGDVDQIMIQLRSYDESV